MRFQGATLKELMRGFQLGNQFLSHRYLPLSDAIKVSKLSRRSHRSGGSQYDHDVGARYF